MWTGISFDGYREQGRLGRLGSLSETHFEVTKKLSIVHLPKVGELVNEVKSSSWGRSESAEAGGRDGRCWGWGLHLLESGIPLTGETRSKYGLVLSFQGVVL